MQIDGGLEPRQEYFRRLTRNDAVNPRRAGCEWCAGQLADVIGTVESGTTAVGTASVARCGRDGNTPRVVIAPSAAPLNSVFAPASVMSRAPGNPVDGALGKSVASKAVPAVVAAGSERNPTRKGRLSP